MTSRSPLSPTGSPVRRLLGAAAAALGIRTAAPTPTLPVLPAPGAADADVELTAQLRQLHDDHVERANAAVAEGREDLLQELSDSYVEQAMALMTGVGTPPVRTAHPLAA